MFRAGSPISVIVQKEKTLKVLHSFLKKFISVLLFCSNHKGCNKLINNEESRIKKIKTYVLTSTI